MLPDQPNRFGKYLLLERIGVGGMAEVFKAKTFGAEGFERLVAIKRILPHLVEDDDFVKMFIDEAKIAVRLNHPNIVGIQDLGKAEGTLYIAMEFVQGRDLRAIYDFESEHEGHPPIGIAAHVVMKMCEALHHAHFATGSRGEPLNVIHRDVSPQNVLVSYDGEVKVADFGLAKARGRMVQTQAGVVKGKLAYMSPEQLRGEDIDHRVDVFGLGIVLYEMLAGERLFLGPSDMDTLRRVYEAKVPPMTDLNPDVHPELEEIVRKALAKDRDQRYQTALELHDDLQAFVYGHGCYAGTSSLRTYLREAFPESAPLAPALPPFAPAPPTAPPAPQAERPRPTHRPPKLQREEIPPPPSIPPSSLPSLAPGVPLAVPSAAVPSDPVPEPGPFDAPIDDPTGPGFDAGAEFEDDLPTDRPPPFQQPDVVARAVVETGRPPPPDRSGTLPADRERFPSEPPGLYGEEFQTIQPDALAPPGERGPDTNPAPAPELPSFVSDGWEDDEPTMMVRGTFDEVEPARSESSPDDPWADESEESTAVINPPSSGHG